MSKNDPNEIDVLIDKMVDGELNLEEQRRLIAECDSRKTWRDLAVAFVESQALRSILRDQVSTRDELDQIAIRESAAPPAATSPAATSPPTPRNSAAKGFQARSEHPPKRKQTTQVLSLAASMLVALGVGWSAGMFYFPNQSPVPSKSAKSAKATVAPAQLPETTMITLRDPNTNTLRQVEVPILNGSEPEVASPRRPPLNVSQSTRDALREQGLQLIEQRVHVLVNMPDGRTVVVPMEVLNLTENRREYQ